MRYLFESVGSAQGCARKLAPQVRLLAGIASGICAIMLSFARPLGVAVAVLSVGILGFAARPPMRILKGYVLLAAALYLPLLLVAGGLSLYTPSPDLLAVTDVSARAVLVLLAGVLTMTVLPVQDLGCALTVLRVPRLLRDLTGMILIQTGIMLSETQMTIQAFAVRGARSGLASAFAVIKGFPRVWLPRVLARSDRVINAMLQRRYTTEDDTAVPLHAGDLAALVVMTVLLGASILSMCGWY